MICKPIVFTLTVLSVVTIALGLNLDHLQEAQNQLWQGNDELEDPARDLDFLKYLGEEHRNKRRRFDKSDPRSLFASVYNNYPYNKRFSSALDYDPIDAAEIVSQKRGLKSKLDPKNLFKSAYGFKK